MTITMSVEGMVLTIALIIGVYHAWKYFKREHHINEAVRHSLNQIHNDAIYQYMEKVRPKHYATQKDETDYRTFEDKLDNEVEKDFFEQNAKANNKPKTA